jgi:hypothetical protein
MLRTSMGESIPHSVRSMGPCLAIGGGTVTHTQRGFVVQCRREAGLPEILA